MGRQNPEVPSGRLAVERTNKRMARLEMLTTSPGARVSPEARTTAARQQVWVSGKPRNIRLRVGLLHHRAAIGGSPLLSLSTPRGCAVQLLLVALFEAQCHRTRVAASKPTTRAVRGSTTVGMPSWLDLVASPTENRRTTTRTARSPEDNRHDQLRGALQRLEGAGRIAAARPTGRDRFEGFSLLHETADNTSTATIYSRPTANEVTVDVPVEFFLNGWVHALSDSETAAYLFLLMADQAARRLGGVNGVGVSSQDWEWAFGPSRAGLVAQRHLARFGLIDVVRPEERRADGTVEGGGEEGAELPFGPHLYLIRDRGLEFRAVPRVIRGLREAHDQSRGVAALQDLIASDEGSPDGWGFDATIAELEQQRLAAPTPPARGR